MCILKTAQKQQNHLSHHPCNLKIPHQNHPKRPHPPHRPQKPPKKGPFLPPFMASHPLFNCKAAPHCTQNYRKQALCMLKHSIKANKYIKKATFLPLQYGVQEISIFHKAAINPHLPWIYQEAYSALSCGFGYNGNFMQNISRKITIFSLSIKTQLF